MISALKQQEPTPSLAWSPASASMLPQVVVSISPASTQRSRSAGSAARLLPAASPSLMELLSQELLGDSQVGHGDNGAQAGAATVPATQSQQHSLGVHESSCSGPAGTTGGLQASSPQLLGGAALADDPGDLMARTASVDEGHDSSVDHSSASLPRLLRNLSTFSAASMSGLMHLDSQRAPDSLHVLQPEHPMPPDWGLVLGALAGASTAGRVVVPTKAGAADVKEGLALGSCEAEDATYGYRIPHHNPAANSSSLCSTPVVRPGSPPDERATGSDTATPRYLPACQPEFAPRPNNDACMQPDHAPSSTFDRDMIQLPSMPSQHGDTGSPSDAYSVSTIGASPPRLQPTREVVEQVIKGMHDLHARRMLPGSGLEEAQGAPVEEPYGKQDSQMSCTSATQHGLDVQAADAQPGAASTQHKESCMPSPRQVCGQSGVPAHSRAAVTTYTCLLSRLTSVLVMVRYNVSLSRACEGVRTEEDTTQQPAPPAATVNAMAADAASASNTAATPVGTGDVKQVCCTLDSPVCDSFAPLGRHHGLEDVPAAGSFSEVPSSAPSRMEPTPAFSYLRAPGLDFLYAMRTLSSKGHSFASRQGTRGAAAGGGAGSAHQAPGGHPSRLGAGCSEVPTPRYAPETPAVDQGIADYRPSWIPAGVAADLIKLPAVEVQRAAWNRLDLEHQLQGIAAAKAAHLLFGSADNGLYRALRHRLSPKEACELRHLINMVKTRKVLTPQERLEVWSRVQWMLAEHLEVDQACQEQEAADRLRGGSGGTATLTCFSTRTRSNAIPHATVSQGGSPRPAK